MPVEVVVALIGTAGTLFGVVIGALLAARLQTAAAGSERAERSERERRELYARFMSASREWRATSMSSDARLVEGSPVSKHRHADGGESAVRALALRSEVALVAHSYETIAAAQSLVKALTRLAEARSTHTAGAIPDQVVQGCRDAEVTFLITARNDLGTPATADDLRKVRRATPVNDPIAEPT